MALFGNDKPRWDADEDEKFNFFSASEAEYTIPSSRKPVVIKKDKVTKKVTERKRTVTKKSDTAKKTAKPTAAVAAEKKTESKKAETKKPAASKAAATKRPAAAKPVAAKPAATKAAAAKKPAARSAEAATVKKPVVKTAEVKKTVTKKPAAKKSATKPMPEAVEIEAAETVTEVKTARNGSFDIKKSKDGRFVFNLYSANRVIIATSQVYSSSQSAMTGIKSVMANAASAEIEDLTLKKPSPKAYPKWEIYIDRAGEYRFRLNASNANCICHAKAGYANKSNCKRGIDSIIRLADDAEVKKAYLNKK